MKVAKGGIDSDLQLLPWIAECFHRFVGPLHGPIAPETVVLSRTDLVKLQNIVGHADQGPLSSYFFDPT